MLDIKNSRISSNVAKYRILSNHVHIWPLVRRISLPQATCYLHHLLIMKFLKHLQNVYTCPPFDAEFYADFKNVYICTPILQIFRVMVSFRPKKASFGENGHFRPLDCNNSKNLEDRYTKVYIFEISIKFRIDWYAGIYILKMFQKFHN